MAAVSARGLVECLGPHPATVAGLDPAEDADRWFILALLLSARGGPEAALAAFSALARDGHGTPRGLATASLDSVAGPLHGAGIARPEGVAALLMRASAALVAAAGGSPAALASDADGLTELGGRFVRLAPGVGHASVARFLRPLRTGFAAAGDIPMAPAAVAAGICTGLLPGGVDGESGAGSLRAALAQQPDAPPLADVEWALEQLGARACRAGRPERCPLGPACPAR